MHVIGTAGHVDHGKSSLVRALTGTDPDRWAEEQQRGMTLDLGFAHLQYDDGTEAGIVDVPGHERYLHNMLAGAAGMDVVLLVIAANEGVREQTREHLAILAYLNVRRVIVVLTKSDLVDDTALADVTAAVHDALRATIADDAPIIAVSTRTGVGLDVLRDRLHHALAAIAPRSPDAPAFLPIDRVFSLAGRGTVVTGTLAQGTLRVGDTLRLTPPDREVRVRSLQVFGATKDAVTAGARVAVNLPGVEVDELQRGAVLADAAFAPRTTLPVRVRIGAAARALLRKRTPVRLTLGAAETSGTLVLATPPHGDESLRGTLLLPAATVSYPEQPFVLRAMSPSALLGGGVVLAAGAADEAGGAAMSAVAALDYDGDRHAAEDAAFARALAAAGERAATAVQLAADANLRVDRIEALAARAIARGDARAIEKPHAFIDGAIANTLSARILDALARREGEAPWLLGATTLALARELAIDEGLLLRFLNADVDAGRIGARSGYYFRVGYRAQLSAEQRDFFERAVPIDLVAPLAPVPLRGVLDALHTARIVGLAQAFETLLAADMLVKIGTDVYRETQIAEIRSRLSAAVTRDGPITPARFRDAIGTSRKYALPLLEWLDATGVTVRDGDLRRLRDR